jgi:hypothetical protein
MAAGAVVLISLVGYLEVRIYKYISGNLTQTTQAENIPREQILTPAETEVNQNPVSENAPSLR